LVLLTFVKQFYLPVPMALCHGNKTSQDRLASVVQDCIIPKRAFSKLLFSAVRKCDIS
jgi:hypothetical protein